jgi:hypothetical protein
MTPSTSLSKTDFSHTSAADVKNVTKVFYISIDATLANNKNVKRLRLSMNFLLQS